MKTEITFRQLEFALPAPFPPALCSGSSPRRQILETAAGSPNLPGRQPRSFLPGTRTNPDSLHPLRRHAKSSASKGSSSYQPIRSNLSPFTDSLTHRLINSYAPRPPKRHRMRHSAQQTYPPVAARSCSSLDQSRLVTLNKSEWPPSPAKPQSRPVKAGQTKKEGGAFGGPSNNFVLLPAQFFRARFWQE
jgi:hypothetical protein